MTIVEWADYECPFCGRAAPALDKLFKAFPGKIRLVFKNYPLSIHQNSEIAARAAVAAGQAGQVLADARCAVQEPGKGSRQAQHREARARPRPRHEEVQGRLAERSRGRPGCARSQGRRQARARGNAAHLHQRSPLQAGPIRLRQGSGPLGAAGDQDAHRKERDAREGGGEKARDVRRAQRERRAAARSPGARKPPVPTHVKMPPAPRLPPKAASSSK